MNLNHLIIILFAFLASCGVRTVAEDSEIFSLNMSRQGLINIPPDVFAHEELKVLKLYGNHIDSIPDGIGNLKNLEKLYIGKNDLKYISPEIGKLKNLKLFSAQYNELTSLPDELTEISNLEQILVNQNHLRKLPDSIGRLKKLITLQAKYNKLEYLPESIGDCEQLQFIHLTQNLLNELPSSISRLRKLRELYVANAGFLVSLPEDLCGLRYFEVLEIDGATVVPSCLLVQQTTRLQIIRR